MSDSEADNLVTFGHIKAAWTFLHTWHIANVKRGEMIRQRVPLVQLVKSSLQQHLVAALNLWCKINQIALKKKKKNNNNSRIKTLIQILQDTITVACRIKNKRMTNRKTCVSTLDIVRWFKKKKLLSYFRASVTIHPFWQTSHEKNKINR